ncbi:MAG TPA: TolC family protein [Bacteroidia bacterium]
MRNTKSIIKIGLLTTLLYSACSMPYLERKAQNKTVPSSYSTTQDSINSARIKWNKYFNDPYLAVLIDSALIRNQELNIILQEINISRNEIRARKGAYLPTVNVGVGGSVEKSGRYTSKGANDANVDILPGKKMPDPLSDLSVGLKATWEVDIWKKLRNSKNAAIHKFLASVDGKNFMVTHLIAEISNTYYELMALDNQLDILKSNIEIQQNALEIVKLQKTAGKVTELAVSRFEAEVLKNQSRQYYIMQQITEAENRLNYLVGRYPQPIARNSKQFIDLSTDSIHYGVPSDLLENRPDIRQAEQMILAAKLDLKAAKAEFYPSLKINSGLGLQGFNPKYLVQSPESMIYSLAGELVAPLVNRNAIKANYLNANAKQIQAIYNFERTVLGAYVEVANQLSNIGNLKSSYDLKAKQIDALTRSIDISLILFKSARADYMEVLLTQRDALESKFELIEIKKQQMNARVNVYKALGGGWQ